MHRRAHRDRRLRGVHAEEFEREFADLRQALADPLLAQVAQVEVHVAAMTAGERPPFLLLEPEGLGEAVARAELHRLVARGRFGRTEAVVLQVAVAVAVDEEAALAAAGLGEQETGARHAGRVVLDELHVA